jgi:hypothetical protein
MKEFRRWYDNDENLKEALELLSLSSENTKTEASDLILKLQSEVAIEVIEGVYRTISKYEGIGSRWYDCDPVMIKAIELLRVAPSKVQRAAAKKLLEILSRNEKIENADI